MQQVKLIFMISLVAMMGFSATTNAQQLKDAENQIHSAYQLAWAGDASTLENLVEDFAKSDRSQQSNHYWEAYANYRLAIYYTATDKKELSETHCEKAIELLEDIKKKTSEDYALLSCLTGFSIQFSPMSAAFLGPKSGKYANKAISLDDSNPRAHFAKAMNDFYTPKLFGGGDLVEDHLKKALKLAYTSEAQQPTWGKDEAFELLVKFFIRENKADEAKLYCKMGLGQYPNDARLKKHAESLGINQ